MKVLIFFFFFLISFCCQSQDRFLLIKEKLQKDNDELPDSRTGGIFGLYKNHISDQILNDCIYDHSCSEFSRGAIKDLGPVRGVLLTADRLMRCNRVSYAETPRIKIDHEGKVKDHWHAYKNME